MDASFDETFSFEAGIKFPIISRFEGAFDNTIGTDKADLEGRLSYELSVGYRFSKSLNAALGYSVVRFQKEKALTGVDIYLSISHFYLGLDYVF